MRPRCSMALFGPKPPGVTRERISRTFVGELDARHDLALEIGAAPAPVLVDELLRLRFGGHGELPLVPLFRGDEVRLGRIDPVEEWDRLARGRGQRDRRPR